MSRLTALLAGLFMIVLLAGCNTLQGAGQDIERAGEGIQDAADG